MSFVKEYAVVDTRLEYLELTRSGALEVFAVDPSELASVHGVSVPEHGAFVARVLPVEMMTGPDAGLIDPTTQTMTKVWRRDRREATVVPAAILEPGHLRDHTQELILMNDDWFILGLRFEVDVEVRRVFNYSGFSALAKQHLRCFVVPEDLDNGARVIVTVGTKALEPVIEPLPLFDSSEPPALDLLRAFLEGPTAAPSPSSYSDGNNNSNTHENNNTSETNPKTRNLTGLFPHQARTVLWMQSVEVGVEGDDDEGASILNPVRFGGRLLYPSGREVQEKQHLEKENAVADSVDAAAVKGERRAGQFGAARAVEAALKTVMKMETSETNELNESEPDGAEKEDNDSDDSVKVPKLPRGGLIAHPVGAGKTVIACALLERRWNEPKLANDRPKTPGTLVTCPGHIIEQWLACLREFAPSLRCRRADARPMDSGDAFNDKGDAFNSGLNPDALPDWSPLTGGVEEWDVLVVAHEDLPRGFMESNKTQNQIENQNYHPSWNDLATIKNPTSIKWHRLVIDEPQELKFDWGGTSLEQGNGAWLVENISATHRWALSATPGTSDQTRRDLLSLLFGRRLTRDEFRKVRTRWTSKRSKRDPPDMCLPTVDLTNKSVPVTLSWREASVVQLYTEALDSTFGEIVRYCGGWSSFSNDGGVTLDGDDFLGSDSTDGRVESLEQWHTRLATQMESRLRKLETRRDVLIGVITQAEEFESNQLKLQGGYNPFDQLDDLLTEEALVDDEDDGVGWNNRGAFDLQQMREAMRIGFGIGDGVSTLDTHDTTTDFEGLGGDNEDGIDLEQHAGLSVHEFRGDSNSRHSEELKNLDPITTAKLELEKTNAAIDWGRRDQSFVAAAHASLKDDDAECSVCFEKLRGKTVSVLRCAHAFDSSCVAQLLLVKSAGMRANRRTITCPLCRAPTRRKNMCTFLHEGGEDTKNKNETENETETVPPVKPSTFSAKTNALVRCITDILRHNHEDKIVVFAQWPETVSLMAKAVRSAAAAETEKNSSEENKKCILRSNDAVTLLGDATTRAHTLAKFQSTDPVNSPRVLFVSYAHYASGLNLHVANHVVIAHPYASRFSSPNAPELVSLKLAAAYERQAVGRVRRYPQKKTCYVYRLYALGTVEEELYAVWGWIV